MVALNSEGKRQRGTRWPAVVGVLLAQILILLALAGLAVRYIEWSSDANQAEFISAMKPSVSDRHQAPPSSATIERVNAPVDCDR
jgi:uncharacterized iron-regulated membrane protein